MVIKTANHCVGSVKSGQCYIDYPSSSDSFCFRVPNSEGMFMRCTETEYNQCYIDYPSSSDSFCFRVPNSEGMFMRCRETEYNLRRAFDKYCLTRGLWTAIIDPKKIIGYL